MGEYTPNRNLYKPAIGETGWGDKVNQNWDILDTHDHVRSEISDFFSSPFWDLIPDKPSTFPPASHTHEIADIIDLADKLAGYDTLISRIKTDMLTIALNVMMNKALVHAETKDFYSIIADVITDEYPNGFKNTFETLPTGVTFDNDGGGNWTKAIKITLTTVPSEYAQYRIVIQSNTMQIYSADGTLKADYGASTGVASDFWDNVKSDGSDIRIADQNYSQLYFWIEEWDYSGKYAVIWVKVEAGTSELYIAYGNADALPSAYNDPNQVFELFDDFNDGVIDTSKWGVIPSGASELNGYLEIAGDGTNEMIMLSAQSFSNPIVIEADFYIVDATIDIAGFVFVAQDTDNLYMHQVSADPNFNKDYFRFHDKVNGKYTLRATASTGLTINTGVWYKLKAIIKNTEHILQITPNGTPQSLSTTQSWTNGYVGFRVGKDEKVRYDNFKVLKLTDPAEFGTAEVTTLVTTGGFITVTFSFDEGVDKLLITVDTDAQAVYYSTDDGATWNPITPDEETLLPETAYSVKWKFEFATYVRGYAFITW